MALEPQPPSVRKRVKVYELRDNDWFDRGTGFCTGQFLGVRIACPGIRATSPAIALVFVRGRWSVANAGLLKIFAG